MAPKVFYFDLGNVLLEFSHERMYWQMAEAAGVTSDALHEALFGDPKAAGALMEYETGRLTTDEYFEIVQRALGKKPDTDRFARAARDIFTPIDSTLDLVRTLAAAGQRLAILSNTNPLHWEFLTDGRYPLIADIGQPGSAFGWAVLSYKSGAMKPLRAIFETAIERAGVAADEIFFVDDVAENVAGARDAGIDAVQFVGAEKLSEDLRERGVTV